MKWLLVILLSTVPAIGAAAGPVVGVPPTADASAAAAAHPLPAGSLYFGDLHVHTSYSFNSCAFGTRPDPAAAYVAARGVLDFAAVTDPMSIEERAWTAPMWYAP